MHSTCFSVCTTSTRSACAALGLLAQIVERELTFSCVTRQATPCSMRARAVRSCMALAAHDERTCTHAARNDAKLAGTRRDCAFTRNPHLLSEVFLYRAVVVVAVDR